MLRRYCHQSNLPMVKIHRVGAISQYGLGQFVKKGKTSHQRQNDLFVQSVTEYKYILRNFWHECVVKLLNFKADDLNKISLDSYIHMKIRKH